MDIIKIRQLEEVNIFYTSEIYRPHRSQTIVLASRLYHNENLLLLNQAHMIDSIKEDNKRLTERKKKRRK